MNNKKNNSVMFAIILFITLALSALYTVILANWLASERNKTQMLEHYIELNLEPGFNEYYAGYEDGYHVAIHQLSQN